jgi:TPP-dependent 2-oxoacid decarboxylase
MAVMTGSRFFAEAMQAYGVSHIFFVPTMLLPAMAEMEDMNIRRVVTHGEKAAAYMADGYARASRKPGICMAQNVGAANLAAGLRDAYMASSPVIAITGGPDSDSRYRYLYIARSIRKPGCLTPPTADNNGADPARCGCSRMLTWQKSRQRWAASRLESSGRMS